MQHLEVHWRLVIGLTAGKDPVELFGVENSAAVADIFKQSLTEIKFWVLRMFPTVTNGNFISSYFSASMHVLVEHGVEDFSALPEGESLASYSTAIFELSHVLTRIMVRDHTGGRGNLKNAESVWTELVRNGVAGKVAALRAQPQLLKEHQAASKERWDKLKPAMRNVAECAELAVTQRKRCCDENLDSILKHGEDGQCTLELLDTPCPAHAVCEWDTSADACKVWESQDPTAPPTVGPRCMKMKTLDGLDDSGDGDDDGHNDDGASDAQREEQAIAEAATEAAEAESIASRTLSGEDVQATETRRAEQAERQHALTAAHSVPFTTAPAPASFQLEPDGDDGDGTYSVYHQVDEDTEDERAVEAGDVGGLELLELMTDDELRFLQTGQR